VIGDREALMSMRVVVTAICVALIPLTAHAKSRPRASAAHALSFAATAYCRPGRTASGTRTRNGIVAADPRLLPIGSVLRIEVSGRASSSSGVYTVMDTGSGVKRRTLDIFISDCRRAKIFGKQIVRVRVLRRGWSPDTRAPEDERTDSSVTPLDLPSKPLPSHRALARHDSRSTVP
jgi:3D (Asp-Asp-Asp) domain-containing protein